MSYLLYLVASLLISNILGHKLWVRQDYINLLHCYILTACIRMWLGKIDRKRTRYPISLTTFTNGTSIPAQLLLISYTAEIGVHVRFGILSLSFLSTFRLP